MSRTFPWAMSAADSLTSARLSAAPVGYRRPVGRAGTVFKRTLRAFYDDQMTHHAAALTYYALMSLFPSALVALSLLSLLGQYPDTYLAITDYLAGVVPPSVLEPVNRSLRRAMESEGTAATALAVSVPLALYGTTGALEAARRALNVVFELGGDGRSFLRRKAIDTASTLVLLTLVLASVVMVFVGGRFAEDLLGFLGMGETVTKVWNFARWPGALVAAMLAFAFVYYVTPDVRQRAFHWLTPGAAAAVLLWLGGPPLLSPHLSNRAD